jgi:hypothetical protein
VTSQAGSAIFGLVTQANAKPPWRAIVARMAGVRPSKSSGGAQSAIITFWSR